jgi:zeta-carotene desaturase
MRVAIVGAGLAGLATAVDLADAGWEVKSLSPVPLSGESG